MIDVMKENQLFFYRKDTIRIPYCRRIVDLAQVDKLESKEGERQSQDDWSRPLGWMLALNSLSILQIRSYNTTKDRKVFTLGGSLVVDPPMPKLVSCKSK